MNKWRFWRLFARVRFVITGDCGLNCGVATFRKLDGTPFQQFVPEADCPVHDLEGRINMPFLTPEETGGPLIFSLRQSNRYLAIRGRWDASQFCAFDIEQLVKALGQDAGETWQEHVSLIKLACVGGRLFEWLNIGNKDQEVK